MVVEIDGAPEVDQTIIQEASGVICLSAIQAIIHKESEDSSIMLSRTGAIKDWFYTDDWLGWDYITTRPGEYDIRLSVYIGHENYGWDFVHEVEMTINGQTLACCVNDKNIQMYGQPLIIDAGRIRIDKAEHCNAKLKALDIKRENLKGLTFMSLQFVPMGGLNRSLKLLKL